MDSSDDGGPPRLKLAQHKVRWPDEVAGPFSVRLSFAEIGEGGRERAECVGVEIRSFDSTPGPDGEVRQGWDPRSEDWIPLQPVTASLLRKVPIGTLIDRAREQAARQSPLMAIASTHPPDWFQGTTEEWMVALEEDPRFSYYPPPERFPGSDQEWIDLPENERRPFYPPEEQDWVRRNQARWQTPPRRRSGRRMSRGLTHLADVAVVYAKAYRDQVKRPVRAVAEWGGVDTTLESRTAAMWVSRARREGFLTPATRGKAGGHLLVRALDYVSEEMRPIAEALIGKDTVNG